MLKKGNQGSTAHGLGANQPLGMGATVRIADLIEQGVKEQGDDYLLFWSHILKIDDLDALRAGLAIMRQIADKRREIDGLYGQLGGSMDMKAFAKRRPMQLLERMGQRDMTLTQAAQDMGISLNTANQHIAKARKSFFCQTNAGAIYAAVKEGLI